MGASGSPYEFELDLGSTSATVSARGELDLAAREALRRIVAEAGASASVVVVDLGGASFVAARVLSVVCALRQETSGEGRRMSVVLPQAAPVRELVERFAPELVEPPEGDS